jgi:hypothetical protein
MASDHFGVKIAGFKQPLVRVVGVGARASEDLIALGIALAVALQDDLIPASVALKRRIREKFFVKIQVVFDFRYDLSDHIRDAVAQIGVSMGSEKADTCEDERKE